MGALLFFAVLFIALGSFFSNRGEKIGSVFDGIGTIFSFLVCLVALGAVIVFIGSL